MNILVRPYCTSSPAEGEEEDLVSSCTSNAAAAFVSREAVAALAKEEGDPVESGMDKRRGCVVAVAVVVKWMCGCVDLEGVSVV